jgi:hypothetical protein
MTKGGRFSKSIGKYLQFWQLAASGPLLTSGFNIRKSAIILLTKYLILTFIYKKFLYVA